MNDGRGAELQRDKDTMRRGKRIRNHDFFTEHVRAGTNTKVCKWNFHLSLCRRPFFSLSLAHRPSTVLN